MKKNIVLIIGLLSMVVASAYSAQAVAFTGADGKTYFGGSDAWSTNIAPAHETIVPVPVAHHQAAKRMCLSHVDNFVKAVKATTEDHVRLANYCSRGYFNHVWKLTGGISEKLVEHEGNQVEGWEKEVREAASHLKGGGVVPSEAWLKHMTKLNK